MAAISPWLRRLPLPLPLPTFAHISINNVLGQRYGEEGFAYADESNAFLADEASTGLLDETRILCLAEGEGRNLVALTTLGKKRLA